MKFGLTLVLFSLTSPAWGRERKLNSLPVPAALSAGAEYACAIDEQGVKCWGKLGMWVPANLKNPRVVTVGNHHGCALDDEGVKCWSRFMSGGADVPPLKNPKAVSAGGNRTCAVDDEGAKCWEYDYSGHYDKIKIPPFIKPESLSVGAGHVCAVDEGQVKCWQYSLEQTAQVPSLNNPISVSAGGNGICALHRAGITCWGYDSVGHLYGEQLYSSKNPRSLSVGFSHFCAVGDEGLKCWNTFSDLAPYLRKPKLVSAGSDYTCVLDEQGIKCWGTGWSEHDPYEYHPVSGPVPGLAFPFATFPDPRFDLDQISTFLGIAQDVSTPSRSRIFLELKKFSDESLPTSNESNEVSVARYLLLALLSPAVFSGDTQYTKNTLVPAFSASMKDFEGALGYKGTQTISHSRLNNIVALQVTRAALTAVDDFLTQDDRAQLQSAHVIVDQALADPNEENILKVVVSLRDGSSIFRKLGKDSKSIFFRETFDLVLDWLGRS